MTKHKKIREDFHNALNYSDVFIIPKYSTVSSRKEVDISSTLGGDRIPVPVLAANMESVTNDVMSIALMKSGAPGMLHRFQSIEDNVSEFKKVTKATEEIKTKVPCFVSVGVNRDSHERAAALYDAGARHFVIDIAHAHSLNMERMIAHMKRHYSDIHVMAGNVANPDGVRDLIEWGANSIKLNIGPGSVCITKNVTGVTIPAFSNILKCVEVSDAFNTTQREKAFTELYIKAEKRWTTDVSPTTRQYNDMAEFFLQEYKNEIDKIKHDTTVPIIADGGFLEIGDICKALGAGADFIMTGRLLAGCNEAPNGRIYRGSASNDVQERYRNDKQMPTPEGKSEILESAGSVSDVIRHISGGIRSSFSYVGARSLKEFHELCEFGTRRHVKYEIS